MKRLLAKAGAGGKQQQQQQQHSDGYDARHNGNASYDNEYDYDHGYSASSDTGYSQDGHHTATTTSTDNPNPYLQHNPHATTTPYGIPAGSTNTSSSIMGPPPIPSSNNRHYAHASASASAANDADHGFGLFTSPQHQHKALASAQAPPAPYGVHPLAPYPSYPSYGGEQPAAGLEHTSSRSPNPAHGHHAKHASHSGSWRAMRSVDLGRGGSSAAGSALGTSSPAPGAAFVPADAVEGGKKKEGGWSRAFKKPKDKSQGGGGGGGTFDETEEQPQQPSSAAAATTKSRSFSFSEDTSAPATAPATKSFLSRRASRSVRHGDGTPPMHSKATFTPSAYETYGSSHAEARSIGSDSSLPEREQEKVVTNKKSIWAGLSGKAKQKDKDRDRDKDKHIDDSPPPVPETTAEMTRDQSAHGHSDGRSTPAGRTTPALKQSVSKDKDKDKDRAPWFDVKNLGAAAKGAKHAETEITAQIGWLCAHPDTSSEWTHVYVLAEAVAQSPSASKEAARALRKEFKWGESEPQKRAVKLWALFMLTAGEHFRSQIATKRFLEVIEHTVTDRKTSLSVKERLLDAWAMFAHQLQHEPELSVITKSYNKCKPNDRALNGDPFDPGHAVFVLAPAPTASSVDHLPQHMAMQTSRSESWEILPATSDPSTQTSTMTRFDELAKVIPLEEDRRRLFEECSIARTNASLLIDAITNSGLYATETAEFLDRVENSQTLLSSQIPWASSQADLSRRRARELAAAAARPQQRDDADASFESMEQTPEERLLADILDAREQLSAAHNIYEEAKADEAEKEEERRITELSMVDFRVDRTALQQDPVTGDLYSIDRSNALSPAQANNSLAVPPNMSAGAAASSSSSRPTSPRMGPRPLPTSPAAAAAAVPAANDSQKGAGAGVSSAAMAPQPSAHSQSSAVRIASSPPDTTLSPPPTAPPLPAPVVPARTQTSTPTPTERHRQTTADSTVSSIVQTPTQPSAKALGKRRAVSRDENTQDGIGEVQAAVGRLHLHGGQQLQDVAELGPGVGMGPGAGAGVGMGIQLPERDVGAPFHAPHPQQQQNPHAHAGAGTATAAGTGLPPALPPVPAAYREQAQQEQERKAKQLQQQQRLSQQVPVTYTHAQMQSNNPYAAAAAAAGQYAPTDAAPPTGNPQGNPFRAPAKGG